MKNRQLRLRRHIKQGEPVSLDLFDVVENEMPKPGKGQFLAKTIALGTSPAQRAYLMGSESRFHPPLALGDTMRGRGAAEVVLSNHPDYPVGSFVSCSTGWQDYSIQDGDQSRMPVKTLQHIHHPQDPLYLHLGTLGASAFAAYFGLLDIGRPKPGETVLISSCAGGVGSIAAQIAKLKGCKVVGIAGGPEKCAWLKDVVGVDAAIDYKNDDLSAMIRTHCPDGVNVYFDNVGGEILEACLENLAYNARIVLCGSISEYAREEKFGLKNYTKLRDANAVMHGYFVYNYLDQFESCNAQLAAWIAAGQLKPLIDQLDGFDKMPEALIGVYTGANVGTRCVKVKQDEA